MKRLSLYVFLVLMFSLFTSHSFAAKKHKIYKKLPCSFNGVKVGPSATPYEDKKIRRHRCAPGSSGYVGKKGTSIEASSNKYNPKSSGIPVVAITNMTLYSAKNWGVEYGCASGSRMGGRKGQWGNVNILNSLSGKKERCSNPFDNVSLWFTDDKYGNTIRYYHLKSTTLVPGFNKGKCKKPKFGNFEEIQKNDFLDHAQPENCGGIKFYKVKKGEVIGEMGYAGNSHFSLGIGSRKTSSNNNNEIKDTDDCKGIYKPSHCYDAGPLYLIAPEDRFEWENLPTDSDAYLFPVMSKKYLKEIGYID